MNTSDNILISDETIGILSTFVFYPHLSSKDTQSSTFATNSVAELCQNIFWRCTQTRFPDKQITIVSSYQTANGIFQLLKKLIAVEDMLSGNFSPE